MVEPMAGQATVALDGLAHPHSDMYLETLEALDEVGGVVLVDPDDAARETAASLTTKARGSDRSLEAALARPEVTHVLVALPNDRTPAALVQAIDAGKGVFTEKPGARSAAEFGRCSPRSTGDRCHSPLPTSIAGRRRCGRCASCIAPARSGA